jgi:hypothetical protein
LSDPLEPECGEYRCEVPRVKQKSRLFGNWNKISLGTLPNVSLGIDAGPDSGLLPDSNWRVESAALAGSQTPSKNAALWAGG